MVKHWLRTALIAATATALGGCSWIEAQFKDDKVQYEQSDSRAPLEIPPDLTSVPRNDRYVVPQRPQIVSANAEAAKERMIAEDRGEVVSSVLPQTEVCRISRDGTLRFVHCSVSADRVWPVLQDFWASVGLTTKQSDATTGVIVTEWAENKANLPKDIIRGTIGKVFDFAYDTGERDQYRARLERNEDGSCNIYITHRSMWEVLKGREGDTTIWQPGPTDPGLEVEMLTRLAQHLDFEFNPNAKPEEQKALDAMAALKYTPASEVITDTDGTPLAVVISEPFDRAWRRVGVALDRGGFDVSDRDRSRGLFMIKYLDPDYEAEEKAKQGFFTNMFSRTKPVDPVEFQIRLIPEGGRTRVTVTGAEGTADETGVAVKIINLIGEQTR